MRAHLTLIPVVIAGCSGVPYQPHQAVPIPPEVLERGQTVYFGTTYPLAGGAPEPLFVYERRVAEEGGTLVSTHLTRDPAGALAIADTAVHSTDYQLLDYTLHTDQQGRTGAIHVGPGEVTLRLGDRTAVEKLEGPVVVGPTLVGFILRRLPRLEAGETIPVRFAVLDRLETLGFELRVVPAAAGQTRVRMSASSFLISLVVDPVFFTFDGSGKLVRIEGRVPPRRLVKDRWQDLDARVEYRYVAAAYR